MVYCFAYKNTIFMPFQKNVVNLCCEMRVTLSLL